MKRQSLVLLLLMAASLGPATAQITVSNESPRQGETVTISLGRPDSLMTATYRPNSSLAQQDTLRSKGLSMTFQWTPERAGVVSLAAPGQGTRNVSVRFSNWPAMGILVLIMAGTILLGGAAFAFGLLFREDEEDMEDFLEHRADT